MKKPKKIIFVDKSGVLRAPMAAGIFQSIYQKSDIDVLIRGLLVQFPEPLNPKVEAVLAGNDIKLEEFSSKQIDKTDIMEDTIIFTMEEKQKVYLIEKLDAATEKNTFLLSTYVGEELEIIDPYGGTIQTYGLCYESMKSMIQKLVEQMEEKES